MSNQNEGNIFVNPNETLTFTDYVSQLFPDMMYDQVQKATYVYQHYGTALEQAITVMGDCKSRILGAKNLIVYSL